MDGVEPSLRLLASLTSSIPMGLEAHAIAEDKIAAKDAPHIVVGGWIKSLAALGFAGVDDVG